MYKILFVDDDTTIRSVIKSYRIWEHSEFYIERFAENEKEALDILQKERFALVITDIRMPVIDGLELVRKMRERGDRTCVILSSAYGDFKYAKEGIRLGVLDYIEKPYTQEKLEEALVYARRHLTQNQSVNIVENIYEVMFTQIEKNRLYDMLLQENVDALSFCSNMAEHLEEDNLIDKVSREVELSRDYLGRIFKARTGFSLSEFSTALKIDQAKKLLTESNLKIYEISDRLGYATVDYFSRLFRNYAGQTPAAYRKNKV